MQDCPWRVNRIAVTTASTVRSSSESGNTIDGFLPPSSSEIGSTRSAATAITLRPTSVDPVNESLSIAGVRDQGRAGLRRRTR